MYQHVVICGNLGSDPEARGAATTFSIAVSDRRKVDGEWQDATEWFRCVAFGRQGEILASDARKGDKVLVEGKMRTSSWNDRETGDKRYKTELIALFVRQMGKQPRREDARISPDALARHAQRRRAEQADTDVPF